MNFVIFLRTPFSQNTSGRTTAPTQTSPVDPLETVKQLSNKYNYNESNTLPNYVLEFTRSKDSLELH